MVRPCSTVRRLLTVALIVAAGTVPAAASGAAKVAPLKFIEQVSSVTGLHATSGLPGFPARDYLAAGGSLVRAPFSGCVPTYRPWGWLAYQSPSHGFGGARVYLRQNTTGKTAYLAHFGNPAYGGIFVRPGECFHQGDPVGHVWHWPGTPGRSHTHTGWQGGDPLPTLVDQDGNFLIREGPVWTPSERVFPRPRLRHEGRFWRVQVGEKRVYQGSEEKARVMHKRQKLGRRINLHFKHGYDDSPLVGFGVLMVRTARAYDVDPRLEAAIASCETSAGTRGRGPYVNNDFGLLTSQGHRAFGSRKQAIRYLSKLLATRYIADGLDTIPKIGARYAPVGASNDPAGKNSRWVSCVTEYYTKLGGTRYLPGR